MTAKINNYGGECQEKFQKVEDAFKQNFSDGWEHEGAALAVYHNNELVVDIWGGFADASSGRFWNKDTMSTVFSCTKSMCALVAAKLVDCKLMSYDDLVTKYWPAFGQNGKDNITIRQLISHQAGLVVTDTDITIDHFKDHKKMAKVFEEQTPNWTVDTDTMGYHLTTYGCLVNQLVRRCDPQHRSLGQYFRDEILLKTGFIGGKLKSVLAQSFPNYLGKEELYIGLPPSLEYRVARLSQAGAMDILAHLQLYSHCRGLMFRVASQTNWILKKAFTQPKFVTENAPSFAFNNPDYRFIEWGAATGTGTARGLAQPFNALCQGQLLSSATLQQIGSPLMLDSVDRVVGLTGNWGHGFHYHPCPNKPEKWIFGHPGFGGQNVKVDLENGLAWAYLTNGLKPTSEGDHTRTYERIQTALYDSL